MASCEPDGQDLCDVRQNGQDRGQMRQNVVFFNTLRRWIFGVRLYAAFVDLDAKTIAV